MLSVRPRCSTTPRIELAYQQAGFEARQTVLTGGIENAARRKTREYRRERLLRLGGIALLPPHGDDLGLDVDARHPVRNGGIVVDGARICLAHQLGK